MDYTIQENVRIVIALLKQYNIRHIVISPGGTNIPITQAVQDDKFFHCYSIADERSAMYFAIGVYLQTGEIVATSCTSAQATRNYLPGLTEAFYKHVPILALTTAKLERFQYQDYMQAPDQCSLPKDSVKCSFDLPQVTDENTRIECINNARNAILEVMHRSPGPVQLNIRINDSMQGKFQQCQLPVISHVKRYMAWDEWNDFNIDNKRILIVVGEHRPFSSRQKNAIERFCEHHNTFVYVNHLSNYNGTYSLQANLLIACGGLKKLPPDIVITIGGQTGDYPVYNAISQLKGVEHWRVSENGDFVNTYGSLCRIFECPDFYFFEKIDKEKDNSSCHDYYKNWQILYGSMDYEVELPFSNLYVAQKLHNSIPQNSIINYAILNSLRCWNYFPLDESIRGFANVAAFGIDGCNSMLIGESVNSDELCFIVTGDLAFFYDMNSLGIRHIKNNVRILLINNGGGAEFKIMTGPWTYSVDTDKYISANGHFGNAKGWAEACGFEYIPVTGKSELDKFYMKFLTKNNVPILMEVFTDAAEERDALSKLTGENSLFKDSMPKKVVKKILGESALSIIKKIKND